MFGTFFLSLSNVQINFNNQELNLRLYTIKIILFTIRRFEQARKKSFTVAAFDPKDNIFIIHIAFFANLNVIYLSHRVQIALLKRNKVSIIVLPKYTQISDIFSRISVMELLEYTEINDYTIKLIECKQLPYKPTYSLRLIKLDTLKIYIKTNLVNSFTKLFMSFVDTLILFDQNLDNNFCLYINYQDFNNLIIKN